MSKNLLLKGLGALWLLDGLLQFQAKMFGTPFVQIILVPNLSGQPPVIHAAVALGMWLWQLAPATWNMFAALLQTLIGVLLFFPQESRTVRFALWLSVGWSLVVWLCGEGAGLLFTGGASFYTGAPGAVLIYALIALMLLYRDRVELSWFSRAAGLVFVLGAFLQLQPVFWTSDGVQSVFMGGMDSFSFIANVPIYLAHIASFNPALANTLLILPLTLLGFLLLYKPSRALAIASLIFIALTWWLGQDFGMLSTVPFGTATDPQLAPLLALLLLPLVREPLAVKAAKPMHEPLTYLVPAFVTAHLSPFEKDKLLRLLILAVVVLSVFSIMSGMGMLAPGGMEMSLR